MNLNRNDYLYHQIFSILKVYFFYISVFTLFRLFFTFYFGETSVIFADFYEILYAYYLGWKYDTLVCSYLLAPLILYSFISASLKIKILTKVFDFILPFYATIFLIIILAVLISDMGFYSYFQDHLNILFYGFMEDDTQALIETMEKNYPFKTWLSIVFAFIAFSFFGFKKVLKKITNVRSKFSSNIFVFFLSILVVFILLAGGLRGGYSMLVISPKYSNFSDNEFINQISLNGFITFDKARKLRASTNNSNTSFAKIYKYSDINNAISDYLEMPVNEIQNKNFIELISRKTPENAFLKDNPPHVVVFIMESFGAHWNQFNSTQFNFLGGLAKHFKQDYYFDRFLSEENGTIGSLMAIASNIPGRRGARYLSESKYMVMPLESSLHIPYKTNGYHTQFYYGGKLGWRDIGKYFRTQAYDEVKGENAIRKNLNLKGRIGTEWGLYDEYLFQDIYGQLDQASSPQFILALSTTNHPPFEVPESYRKKNFQVPSELRSRINREEDIFKNRFMAFEYSNQKLAEFISKVKNSKLGENTIIVVTGDHNFWGFINYSKKEAFMKHTVPLYMYIPSAYKPKSFQANRLGSHKDIGVTLYELSLSNTSFISFGQSMFSTSAAIAFNGNIIANDNALEYKDKLAKWSKNLKYLSEESEVDGGALLKKYRSTISVADHYLRYVYKEFKAK